MDADSFLDAACGLLAIPSTADRPDQLIKALDYVIEFVGPGVTVERFESGGKPSALIYPGPARPHFRLMLNAHVDVVPAPRRLFVPRKDGDRLYARGAHDMKVSGLVLARVFRELALRVPYAMGLQLVTDEEVGGRNGTKYQLDHGVTAEFVVIGEQSGLDIVTDSKGIAAVTLRAEGTSGHSAYPWNGDNALVKLLVSIGNMLQAYPVPPREEWRTTVGVTRIETPNQTRNQIPDRAQAWLDIRFPPEDENLNGRTLAEVTSFLAGFCEPRVVPVVESSEPAHHADHGRPEVIKLTEAVRAQGYRGDLRRRHGSADARFYFQAGVDAVIFGIGGDGLHGDDEFADITTIEPYYRALLEFAGAGGAQG